MIEKLERIVNILKTLLWYVLAPIIAIFAIFRLNGNRSKYLTSQKEAKAIRNEVKNEVNVNEAKKKADDAEANYIKHRDAYLARNGIITDKDRPK